SPWAHVNCDCIKPILLLWLGVTRQPVTEVCVIGSIRGDRVGHRERRLRIRCWAWSRIISAAGLLPFLNNEVAQFIKASLLNKKLHPRTGAILAIADAIKYSQDRFGEGHNIS